MRTSSLAAVSAIATLIAVSSSSAFEWRERVWFQGSNTWMTGRQVAGPGAPDRTEWFLPDGSRAPASFEKAAQRRWNGTGAGLTGAAAPIAPAADLPLPAAWRFGQIRAGASVLLAPADPAPYLREDEARRSDEARPRRIGFFRDLPETITIDGSSAWLPTPDGGWFASVEIASPGAQGLRFALDRTVVPAGARILVYASNDARNRRGPYGLAEFAGQSRFWTESIWADRVTLECELPPDADPAAVSLSISRIVHTYVKLSDLGQPRAAGSCHNDVSCQPAWSNTAKAVAGLGNVGDDGFLFCTGCLLTDSDPGDSDTYFMTANHCVGSQREADTLEFYWFYQTPFCNGTPPDPASVPRTGNGADYLAGALYTSANDFSFLRLRNPPAAGTFLAGWSTASPATTDVLTIIHHPDGDYKRISFGGLNRQDPNYWYLRWYSGVTEPGSSGAPLFNPAGQFIGQLYGGRSYCLFPQGIDECGRFDKSFPVVEKWLQPSAGLSLLQFPGRRDYDGDGRADLALYHAPSAGWYLKRSLQGFSTFAFGFAGTYQVVGDFDGDGRTDPCVYHPPSGTWFIQRSSNGFVQTAFGYNGTLPVPADYDGDGRTDLAVYEPASGRWYELQSTAGFKTGAFGYPGALPVPNDYDGDGRSDRAVYDPSNGNWFLLQSQAGFTNVQFGYQGAMPVPARYDSDARADIAVYDSAQGRWYIRGTSAGFSTRSFGGSGGTAVPGDYTGDGRADLATYKLSSGTWSILNSANNTTQTTAFGWSEAPPVGVGP